MPDTSKLVRASRSHPCPVCGGDHKCSATPDGLILCGRADGPVAGFAHLGPARDPTWHLYRPDGEVAPVRVMPAAGRRTTPPPNLAHKAEELAAHLTPERAADLAHRLGLPVEVFARVPLLGFDPAEGCWTFPEHDPAGFVVGLVRRFPDGAKRSTTGSHRGLTLVGGWVDGDGPAFLVEGPTDALALAACGLSAVGRPSNLGGAAMLAGLLGQLPEARQLVVVGENDRKPDGLWPGKDGAKRLAEELAGRLGRSVLCTLPPAEYKDVRDWVTDRFAGAADGFDWNALGADIARDLVAHAVTVAPGPVTTFNGLPLARRKFPVPVPIGELELPGPGGVSWVWDGFLARDAVTLFSALPKCGKTTLLAHLLAALPAGGDFCGRPLAPGRAVVVSEEPSGVWASRREEVGVPADAVRVITRNKMARCGSLEEWAEFVAFLAEQCDADPADLVVFDTLANLWPVKDENSAAEVGAALAVLHKLTAGRSVLLVHHLRKSDGAEGTGSRGSGALAGFVDVIVELRRQKPSADPSQRKRVLSGYGRYDAIPTEWVIELTEGNPSRDREGADCRSHFVAVGEGGSRPDRDGALRQAILGLLSEAAAEGLGLTRKEIWESLPGAVRRNEPRVREVIEAGVGKLWRKEDRGPRKGGAVYRLGLED
jgi:hypothetical protein